MIRVGVDVGGTFTDITALDAGAGRVEVLKLPTTLHDQSEAVADGVGQALADLGASPGDVGYLGHGTTTATNTLLELDGARTALVVTGGFRDLLEIARQRRPSLYDLFTAKPPVLVPRSRTVEVAERVDAAGAVRVALEDAEVERVVAAVAALGVDAVAVCFLHAYRNPAHERRVAQALRAALPGVFVSTSSAVAPEFREYERCSTTVINSFVGPRMAAYIRRLASRTRDAGFAVLKGSS